MSSRHFSIWIVSPPGYLHSRCFEEVALSLQAAFAALGFDVPIVTDPVRIRDWALVLGANLLTSMSIVLPPRLILYNLEQIQKDSAWLKTAYIDLLRRYPVWDYSERNISALKELYGITNVTLCGIGYMPVLSRIAAAAEDIDVLFIGSMNGRRRAVLEEIAGHGENVSSAFNTYGEQRDGVIARAKLVLNLHFYEAQVLEIVRVSYLLANRKCVVSETGHDEALEAPLRKGVAFAPYGRLTAACLQLLQDNEERLRLAEAGFECFRACSQVPMLKNALAALSDK
jgi:hypothetical protein